MTFTCHENWVRQVIFHSSFKYIISCSDDKTIRILDIKVRQNNMESPVSIFLYLFLFSVLGGKVYENNHRCSQSFRDFDITE
jgi:WD40 repeat protein